MFIKISRAVCAIGALLVFFTGAAGDADTLTFCQLVVMGGTGCVLMYLGAKFGGLFE